MPTRTAGQAVEVSPEEVAEITRLYDSGLYVQACARATALGQMREWRGTAARLIGGRLAANVGAPRLSDWLHLRAWRDDRGSAEAAYFVCSYISRRRGPLAAWRFLRGLPAFPRAKASVRADLLALEARFASWYRDFETSRSLLSEAHALAPESAWLLVEKCDILEKQDAYDEALAAAREALSLRPWYRPAVQSVAHVLQLLGRDEEAIALLAEALLHIESSSVAAALATLQGELDRHAEALASWERVRALAPLMEAERLQWWEGRMSDAHYRCGNLARAADCASRANHGFFAAMAKRLAQPATDARRVILRVEFVRQHHMTCAPATLSALSRYWSVPVDHLGLAATICYDGTPEHVERHWAEGNGWHVREFSVTWDVSRALLDRGIPFAVTLVETQSAHLQAIIGYDSLRGTLLIRDPYQRVTGEWLGVEQLERYASTGPRGMVLVPAGRAVLLEGLALPDAKLYDLRHRIERALHVHDRAAAQQHYDEMERTDPAHWLTLLVRWRLAAYDSSRPRELAAVEELLVRHPKNGRLLWGKLMALRQLARRADYRDFLRRLVEEAGSDALFCREWAEELTEDARTSSDAEHFAMRALRSQPFEADNLRALANVHWNRREFGEATWLYRLAACLRDKVESFARSYFLAARHLRQADDAVAMFTVEFQRSAHLSAIPTRVLFWALTLLDRQSEAFAKLEAALALRQEDGELLLYAADAYARHGEPARAAALLAAAAPRASRAAWLRTAANLADYRCDLREALELWQKLLAEEPLAMDAHRAVARLLAETKDQAAALAHLREACSRFSHHIPLHRLWVEWARGEGHGEPERVLRLLFALDADDAWARRELALVLSSQGRFDEALVELDAAAALEPHSPSTHATRGRVLLRAGRYAAAQEHCRIALRFAIDEQAPLQDLLHASRTQEEKLASLALLREELTRQTVFGDGLLAYREEAYPLLDPPQLLANLRATLAARPDLWHAWSAVVVQLTDMQQLDEALDLARQSTERFPLLARLWLDLAQVHRARRERAAEIPPLRRALQLAPQWGRASRTLADAHERMGEYAESRKVLEHAIAAAPLDASNHGHLAAVLRHLGCMTEAIAAVEHALRLEPGYEWAWESLRAWSPPDAAENRAVGLARELARTRAGEARSWYVLAQSLAIDALDERLAALDRCTALNPRFDAAHELRASLLADAGRFDEAAAACAPACYGDDVPSNLQGRAAWVDAQRGHLRAAIARMQEITARFPEYYWGWNRLADWLCENEEFAKARDAAKTMARLEPRSAVPLGYLAGIQLKLGETKDSRATLERAFELDPTYRWAGTRLLDHYLETRQWEKADAVVQSMRIHLPGASTLVARLRLHCAKLERESALALLHEICALPTAESAAVNGAEQAFKEAALAREAEDAFAARLGDPGTNPEVGACWVRLFAARRAWGSRKQLLQLDPARELTRRARNAYVEALGEHKKRGYLTSLVRRARASLSADPEAWGLVGYALSTVGQHHRTVKWLADWSTRADVRPWMLLNLTVSLRNLQRDDEALDVNRSAAAMKPDHSTPQHLLWIALDACLRGDHPRGAAIVREIRTHELAAYAKALHAIVHAVLAVHSAPDPDRRRVLDEQRTRLDPTASSVSPHAASLREFVLFRARQRALRAMYLAAGQPVRAWLYGWLPRSLTL
ncbi:MAG: tetratricopeptide repeat protein [Planctomycetota bacterium]|nr:MAG: tetratricopeptide repeat protein [Planctomycetota bacterium]